MPNHLSVHYNMNNNICFYFNPLVHATTVHVPVAECLKGVNRLGCKIEQLESKTAGNDPLTPFLLSTVCHCCALTFGQLNGFTCSGCF